MRFAMTHAAMQVTAEEWAQQLWSQRVQCEVWCEAPMEGDATKEEEAGMTAGPGPVQELISAMAGSMETMQKDIKDLKRTYVISKDGITAQPEKTCVIVNLPATSNVTDLRSFLIMAGYYRQLVADFARLAEPLNALPHKGIPWKWSPPQQHAFEGSPCL